MANPYPRTSRYHDSEQLVHDGVPYLRPRLLPDPAGFATIATYESALQQIVFTNSNGNPGLQDRFVTVTINDGEADSNRRNEEQPPIFPDEVHFFHQFHCAL